LPHFFENRLKIMAALFMPIFIIMGVVTVRNTLDWQNDANLFSVFIKKYPERVGNYVTVGLYYEKNKEYAKAIEIYKEALGNIRNEKNRATIFDGLGRSYGMSGQVNNAITAFETALTINPRMSSALVGLGNMARDYDQASYYYTKALEVNSSDIVACNNLVSLNKIHGYWDKAAFYQSKCQTLQGPVPLSQ
jgi:tetratricopeptide (TPR) repeat protein